MPIYRTATFTVKPEGLAEAKMAIAEFVAAVNKKEQGTRLYLSLQEQEDPSRFLHVMAFEDAAAEKRHQGSEFAEKLRSVLMPLMAEAMQVSAQAPIGMDAPAKTKKGLRKMTKKPHRKAAKRKLKAKRTGKGR